MEFNGINISSQGITGAQGSTGAQGVQGVAQFAGIHNALPTVSGDVISYQVISTGFSTSNIPADRLYAIPFIPAKNTPYSSLTVSVGSAGATGLGRILVYDNLNGKPNNKLYESANLDLTVQGLKTALISGTFLAGVTYWLCWYNSANTSNLQINLSSNPAGCLNIDYDDSLNGYLGYYMDVSFGSAPSTFSTSPTLFNGSSPNFAVLIFITIA